MLALGPDALLDLLLISIYKILPLVIHIFSHLLVHLLDLVEVLPSLAQLLIRVVNIFEAF